MLKFSIYYPYSEAATFDMHYYLERHVPLVRKELQEFDCEQIEVVLGQPGIMNKCPHFIAVANLYFADSASMGIALKARGRVLVSDIKNFTDIVPVQEIALVEVTA